MAQADSSGTQVLKLLRGRHGLLRGYPLVRKFEPHRTAMGGNLATGAQPYM
jgi:hypothetical protein